MKVPLSWLADYVSVTGTPQALAEQLLLSGTKVEAMIRKGKDIVFDLEITSNRPDCLSVIGIAREVATIQRSTLKFPSTSTLARRSHPEKVTVTVADQHTVLSYCSVVLDKIKVSQSPPWLANRLLLSGIRPIHNVVDITNYVMLEMGIPMHAFDADTIKGDLTIREGKAGEHLITLDGKQRVLPEGTIVIADNEKLIDLAGIMGGKNSQVSLSTTRVLLHVPIYHPVKIRRAAKMIGLHTEAVTRYEKLLDLTAPPLVLRRAVGLLQELCHARVASPVLEMQPASYYPTSVTVHSDLFEQTLGIMPKHHSVKQILTHLGFTVRGSAQELRITPPPWRRDVSIPEDIVEEIGRHKGYDSLPKTLPKGSIPTPPELFEPDYEAEVYDFCVRLGFSEHYGFTLTSAELTRKIGLRPQVTVANPMSKDFDTLRDTLLTSLLPAVAHNQKYRDTFQLFELGRVFTPSNDQLPNQKKELGLVAYGTSWRSFKGTVEALLLLCRHTLSAEPCDHPLLTQSQAARLGSKGIMGMVRPSVLRAFGVNGAVCYAQLSVEELVKGLAKPWHVRTVTPHPPLKHDLTIKIPAGKRVGDILATMRKAGGPLLTTVELTTIYGQSYTFRLTFQSPTKTLTEQEVSELEKSIQKAVERLLILKDPSLPAL